MNDQDDTSKQYYVDIWIGILGTFLGWTEQRVFDWIEERELWAFLDNPEDMIYHETPPYWITMLLIPDTLRTTLSGVALADLQGRILAAFKDDTQYKFVKHTDWTPYKSRVEAILRAYDASLPVTQ